MFALFHKSTFCSTHAFYSHYSVSSTQKLSVSCLHSATHTHSVLTCIQLSLCSLFHQYSRLHLYCQQQTVQSGTYIQSVSIITTCFTHTFCSTHTFYSLYSVFSTQKQSFSCLRWAKHTLSVLHMRSTFALQSIPPIQSTPSIQSNTNSAVWYLHTVSFNHYNLLHKHILFYSCVLFHLYSLVSHKQLPSCLHSSIKEHSVLPMRSIPSIQSFPHKNSQFLVYTQLHTRILFCPCVNFRFAFHAVKYSRLHLYCQLQTVQSGTYIQSVSIITTCFTHTFCSTHAFYSLYSVFSTQKQSVSCLHTVTHTHFVLPMR